MRTILILLAVMFSACTHVESTIIEGKEHLSVDAWCVSMYYWRWLPDHGIDHVRKTGENHATKYRKKITTAQFKTDFDNVGYGIIGYASAKGHFVLEPKR